MITRLKYLFPGRKFYLLILALLLLFFTSLLDLVGVAVILPVIQVATGEDYTTGYLGKIYYLLGGPTKEEFILCLTFILVGSFILKGVLSLAIRWWVTGFIAKQQAASSVAILGAYTREPYTAHRQRSTAEILQITGSANSQVYTGYAGSIIGIAGEGLSIILLIVLLSIVMPFETLIAFAYFGIASFLIQNFLKKRNMNAGYTVWTKELKASEATLAATDGFRENIIHGVAERGLYAYQEARTDVVNATRLKGFYYELPKYLLEIIFIGGISLIMSYMVLTGGLGQAAYMAVFAAACVRILPNFVRVVAVLGGLRASIPYVEKYDKAVKELEVGEFKFLERDPDIGVFSKVNSAIHPTNVLVENLSYQYPDGNSFVLKNISFCVPEGSSVAFVGGSGSGKTTLIDLILGLLEPSEGQVLANGLDISRDLESWHSKIGYVPQDVFLSGKTVREEIAYGLKDSEIDNDRVVECIKLAELEDVIAGLEEGIYTTLGENGTRLSGGQRQRIGLARAFYRNPSILILDEATSALDNETEHKITQAINRLTAGRTVFVVAHRLSTVRNVDQLLYLSNGQIVSRGTFSEVKRDNEEFARLISLGQLPE